MSAVPEFWFGILVATTVALAIVVTLSLAALIASWTWLSRYAKLYLDRDDQGRVVANVHVRGETKWIRKKSTGSR